MARSLISALNTRHESGKSCLVAGLRSTFSFSQLNMMSAVGLPYMAFIILKFVPSGFPDNSVGKESTCNAGDPCSSPGLGRSNGEGIGCPLQYSWTFPVSQLVKNLPAMWETLSLIPELGRSPGEGKAIHSSILVWRIPWTIWGHKQSDTTERLSLPCSLYAHFVETIHYEKMLNLSTPIFFASMSYASASLY